MKLTDFVIITNLKSDACVKPLTQEAKEYLYFNENDIRGVTIVAAEQIEDCRKHLQSLRFTVTVEAFSQLN